MKTIILCLIFACLAATTTFASLPEQPDLPTTSIRATTDAQMYRYGRELYRKGDYKEAARVFERILAIDCKNKLAQYHLQKIAAQGGAFKDVAKFLKNLPCPAYNFSDEDFLPSSLYYEKDADLVLEQLAMYTKRYRSTRSELTTQISQYKNMITQLEDRTKTLSSSLNTAQKDATDSALWKNRLKESLTLSNRLSEEAAQLKTQLNAAKEKYAHESKALQAQIASSKTSTKKRTTQQELTQQDREIAEKSQELTTLEEKFAALQNRLHQIETSLVNKNNEIEETQKNLSVIPHSKQLAGSRSTPSTPTDKTKKETKNFSTNSDKKDPDPLLEQLTRYNKRYHETQSELASQISQYQNMITQLNEKSETLASSLNFRKKDSSAVVLFKEKLKESMALSEQINQKSAQLETQLNATKAAYAQEANALRTQIAAYPALINTLTSQQTLTQQDIKITEKLQELTTLQEQFTTGQNSLHKIETRAQRKILKLKT